MGVAEAGNSMMTYDGVLTSLGEQRASTLSSAVALPSIPAGALYALVSVEAQPVRMCTDGTTPTSTIGILLPVGTIIGLNLGSGLSNVKFIETAASAAISVSYFR